MKLMLICGALAFNALSDRAGNAQGFTEKFAGLRFDLPARWGRAAVEPSAEFKRGVWRAGKGEIIITRWPGLPPRDGGAMVVARRWKISVAGQKTELLQTKYFRGAHDQVLVAFFKRGQAQFRVVGRKVSQRELGAILRSMRFEQAS